MSSPELIAWIRGHVAPSGPVEVVHERPWSTVVGVPTTDGVVFAKACAPVQGFEPKLSAELSSRWPDRVGEVLAYDEERAWILLADAGTPVRELGNPPEVWLEALPRYAELQRGEAAHAADHLDHGVPDLRAHTLPGHFDEMLRPDLPLGEQDRARLRALAQPFTALCEDLAGHGIPDSVQHDDLHLANLFVRDGAARVLDWGDACVGHPFTSLVVTFRFLEEVNGLSPSDPWFERLRDAYLEPWGRGLTETFALAMRVGAFGRLLTEIRVRDALAPDALTAFDLDFQVVLRRALEAI